MCQFCRAIIKREERYLNKNLDLSVNLFLRLQLTQHFTVEELKWLKNSIESDQYCQHLTRLLPAEFVRSPVWGILRTKYSTIIVEAIRAAYEAKKKNKKVTMDLIYLTARAGQYLLNNSPSDTPNRLNNYQSKSK